jgi:hypothetical protein
MARRVTEMFGLCPSSANVKNGAFRKRNMFLSSGKDEGARTVSSALERAIVNHND